MSQEKCVRTADGPIKVTTGFPPNRISKRHRLTDLLGNNCSKYIRRNELLYSSKCLLTDQIAQCT